MADDTKEVKELLECSPVGACETHRRCWTHSEWQRCGSLIQSVSSDPCEAVVDGLDGLCSGCREFKAMCAQHDETLLLTRPAALGDNRISMEAAVNRDERQKIRDAALAAVNGTRARADVQRAPLEAAWQLQTSNSFRRIGTSFGDGDVLCATTHPRDRQPDLLASPGVLDYVVAAQPRVVLQLLDDVDALETKLNEAVALLEVQENLLTKQFEDFEQMLLAMEKILGAMADVVTGRDPDAVGKADALIGQYVTLLRSKMRKEQQ